MVGESESEGGEKRDKGKGGGEGRGGLGEREVERQKDEDERVGEMMGIKGEMGHDNHGQKLNVDECVIGDKLSLNPDRTEGSEAEAELSTTKKLGQIICIVAGG